MLEEEYARNLQKLARNSVKEYQNSEGKAGCVVYCGKGMTLTLFSVRSFVKSWTTLMRMHETIGEHRIQWAKGLNEMSLELNKIATDCDQERKNVSSPFKSNHSC